jgi:hypothetical protein
VFEAKQLAMGWPIILTNTPLFRIFREAKRQKDTMAFFFYGCVI